MKRFCSPWDSDQRLCAWTQRSRLQARADVAGWLGHNPSTRKEIGMRRTVILLAAAFVALCVTPTAFATQPATGVVQDYADLNGHCPNPEGIAIDPNGNAYAS